MTVIAYKEGVLVADGASFAGGMRYLAMHKKVIACQLGLVGAAGRACDCEAYRAWATSGMPHSEMPVFSMDKDEGLQALWVKQDGTLWWADERLAFVQIEAPGTIGEQNASSFVDGAMWAGASAEEAMRLALRHCVYVGGELTAVRLRPAVAEAAE